MKPLQGLCVALTRPSGQNRFLKSALEGQGCKVLLCPLLETKPLTDPSALLEWEKSIGLYDWLIFVSATAVRFSWPYIEPHFPRIKARFASIGPATAEALYRQGIENVVLPENRFDSEGLLECLSLHGVGGKQICIVRGTHGREVLGNTLEEQGATVVRVGVYERMSNFSAALELIKAAHQGGCHALCLTSSEAVDVLTIAMGENRLLCKLPVFVPHLRIMERARSAGFEEVYCTAGGDQGLLQGIVSWHDHLDRNYGNAGFD